MSGLMINAARGALAGSVATWLMDQVTATMAASASQADKDQEASAMPNGQSSVGNMIDRIEAATGVTVPAEQRPRVSMAIHYALGIVPGALYAIVRSRVPAAGTERGVIYGLGLWAISDEALNTVLGLSGPISAYPMSTHLRGIIGHIVLGVATDTAIEWMDR